MAHGIVAVNQWLYARLQGDAALLALVAHPDAAHPGVYDKEIPPPAAGQALAALYPAVVFQALAAPYTVALGPARLTSQWVYLVKAVGQGRSAAALAPIADRLDTLLQSVNGAVTAGAVYAASAIEALDLAENDPADQPYRHLGARWRLWVPPS